MRIQRHDDEVYEMQCYGEVGYEFASGDEEEDRYDSARRYPLALGWERTEEERGIPNKRIQHPHHP